MDQIIGCGVPSFYDHINVNTAMVNPSTVHVEGSTLNRFFERYLLQEAISVFDWKLPDHWDADYFLYVLYYWGVVAVINTDKYGVIPQACSLKDYNVFYRPSTAVITNPLLDGIKELTIDRQCTLFKLQPDYGGLYDLVSFYANIMALSAQSAGANLVNSKLAYVFGAKNKAQAESFKKMFDKIASGEPAVWIDKQLFNDDGSLNWQTFTQNLNENYIAGEILSDLKKWKNMFLTEIGIPNANTDKKERLIEDEINSNNFETRSKVGLWLKGLQKTCLKTNEMFGLDLWVDWNKELMPKTCEKEGDNDNEE